MKKRPGQHADETAMEYLRRAVQWCSYEGEGLLDKLTTVDAVLNFFDLWHAYDTEFWSGVLECIAEGDSPQAALAFIRKHKLPQGWVDDVRQAQKEMVGA